MFHMKLDFSNSKGIKVDNREIAFFDETSLIDYVCDFLYEEQVKFIVSDDYCDDYGMDCKFDLPCLLEAYNDISYSLLNKQDFLVEFYEQGREYFISFVMSDDNVQLDIRYGYNNICSKKEELTYCYVKKMFADFYMILFEYISKYFSSIQQNSVFNEWNIKLKELNP